MAIEYRMLNISSIIDIQQWRNLYYICFNKSISESQWRWKFTQNPFRNEIRSPIYVAISDDSIIGSLSLLPMQFYLHTPAGKEILRAGLLTNGFVHPDFRKRGIFDKLLIHSMDDAAADGLEILYGYAINAFSAHDLLKHNWREVQGYRSYSCYLNPQQTMRDFLYTLHVPGFLKSITNLVPSEPFMVRKYRKENHDFQFFCGKVEDLLFDIEKIYSTCSPQTRISGVRNRESLHWFFGFPEIKYTCFSMRSEKDLLAYCIIRQKKSETNRIEKIAIIEDSFAKSGNSGIDGRLLSYMSDQLRLHHFTKISTYFFQRGYLASFPLDNGFIYRSDNTRFLYYPVQSEILSDEILNRIKWDIPLAERTPV